MMFLLTHDFENFCSILKEAFKCSNVAENKLFSGKEFSCYDRHLWESVT